MLTKVGNNYVWAGVAEVCEVICGVLYLKGEVVQGSGDWSGCEGNCINQSAPGDIDKEPVVGQEVCPKQGEGYISHNEAPSIPVVRTNSSKI